MEKHTNIHTLTVREVDCAYYYQDVKTGKIKSVKCNSSLKRPDITHYVFFFFPEVRLFPWYLNFFPLTEYAAEVYHVYFSGVISCLLFCFNQRETRSCSLKPLHEET